MRVAIPFENNEVFQHFGHTSQFIFYDVSIESDEVAYGIVDTNGQGHGALASFLANYETDVLICGGIGPGAISALNEAGILVFPGVQGKCGDALIALLKGELKADNTPNCDHHDHGEEGSHCHGDGEDGCNCHEDGEEGCDCHSEEEGCGCHGGCCH